jgi:hypothetical protein
MNSRVFYFQPNFTRKKIGRCLGNFKTKVFPNSPHKITKFTAAFPKNSSTFLCLYLNSMGRGSSVGIATAYGAGRNADRIPVGARFSAPVQTGPGPYPASCTTGTGSFPGVSCSRSVTLTPHTLLVPRSKIELYFFFNRHYNP